jgi:hypothetical protein
MPNSWEIGRITGAGVILGICFIAFSTSFLAIDKFELQQGIEALRTLSVVGIVFGSQATTYVIRARQHLWGLHPASGLCFFRYRRFHHFNAGDIGNRYGTIAYGSHCW